MTEPAISLEQAAADLARSVAKLGGELVETAPVRRILTHAFTARERLLQAQEATLAALNLPTAADVERLTRRVRSVADRIGGLEDALDRSDEQRGAHLTAIAAQLATLQEQLDQLAGTTHGGAV